MHGLASEPTKASFRLDMDGISYSRGAAATTVSPVFSLWLTLVLMYIGAPQLLPDPLVCSCALSHLYSLSLPCTEEFQWCCGPLQRARS